MSEPYSSAFTGLPCGLKVITCVDLFVWSLTLNNRGRGGGGRGRGGGGFPGGGGRVSAIRCGSDTLGFVFTLELMQPAAPYVFCSLHTYQCAPMWNGQVQPPLCQLQGQERSPSYDTPRPLFITHLQPGAPRLHLQRFN